MREIYHSIKGNQIVVNSNGRLFLTKTSIRNFIYSGVFLGAKDEISATLCFELSKTDFPRIEISNQAAEAFTHGKNIYEKAIIKGEKSDTVLVMNRQGDCIGMGEWEDNTIVNLFDVGSFLREK